MDVLVESKKTRILNTYENIDMKPYKFHHPSVSLGCMYGVVHISDRNNGTSP